MMIPLVEHRLEQLSAICQKNFVAKLFLFGSAVDGDFKSNSDLDFAVIFSENLMPLEKGIAFFALKDSLEELFEREIDLLSYEVVKNPIFKQELDKTKVELYAA